MGRIIGVRFKRAEKIHYIYYNNPNAKKKSPVIAETIRGMEYGIIEKICGEDEIDREEIQETTAIIRLATEEDTKKYMENKQKEKGAKGIFIEKVRKHNLDMKLIDVNFTFNQNKIIFYFASDGRVDFRELVKELASIFKTRIELRQIGVRDEAKLLGGIGICGRKLCCSSFLSSFQPVSIKMAKDQSLSLNPSKISGICGRLMCCLKYEQEVYEELINDMPREGDTIKTDEGIGSVVSVNILKQTIRAVVRKNQKDAPNMKVFDVSEVSILKRLDIREDDTYEKELKDIED